MLAILRLIRFSNAPTVVADILAGFLLTTAFGFGWWRGEILVVSCLALCSFFLYSWGMTLNDLYDVEEDIANKSNRPLAVGSLHRSTARFCAILFFLLAVSALGGAFFFDYSGGKVHAILAPITRMGAALLVFTLLSTLIWLYDGPLKKTTYAPWIMGACRGGNLLLGASLPHALHWQNVLDLPADVWMCAFANTLFIAGVTWIARREETGGSRNLLILGTSLISIAYLILAFGLLWAPSGEASRLITDQNPGFSLKNPSVLWPIAVLVIAFPVLRRAFAAILTPHPLQIKQAVIAGLGNLVFIDALICLYAAPGQVITVAAVVLLIIPITLLRRFIPPT